MLLLPLRSKRASLFLSSKLALHSRSSYPESDLLTQLSWPLNAIKIPTGRKQTVHRAFPLRDAGFDADGWDDELEFNTQSSSQWDSLCHVTKDGLAYNGVKAASKDDISAETTAENTLPTVDQCR